MAVIEKFEKYFNEKDSEQLLSLFDKEVSSENLFSKERDFSSLSELKGIYEDLFRVNPNVRCRVLEKIETDSNLALIKHYDKFACGAESKTVWNVTLRDGKICQIFHFSKHKPGS